MAAENAALWRMAPWMHLGIWEFRNGRKAPESSLHRLNREALALNPEPISCVHLGPETVSPKPEAPLEVRLSEVAESRGPIPARILSTKADSRFQGLGFRI